MTVGGIGRLTLDIVGRTTVAGTIPGTVGCGLGPITGDRIFGVDCVPATVL